MLADPNCLTSWYPLLQRAGVPTPQTEIVRTTLPLTDMVEGPVPAGLDELLAELHAAACRVGGYPVFCRTGHTSNKHDWRSSCLIQSQTDWPRRIFNLAEFSACADMLGLPCDVFAVRELLPTTAIFHAYNGLPSVPELRCFLEPGRVLCQHSYWPYRALEVGQPDDPQWDHRWLAANQIVLANPALAQVEAGSRKVARLIDRPMSLDWLWVQGWQQWVAIDMAVAEQSFHWDNCPVARERGWFTGHPATTPIGDLLQQTLAREEKE